MIFNLTGNLTGRVEAVPPAAGGSAAYTKDEADAAFAPLSHVSDPTVHHTASEIGGIAAAKVAEVVADAPDNLDTLKEIADVIGTETGQAAGGILKRVADLEAGKADKAEMLVTPGTGVNAGKATIQLKNGTSATVLTAHQDINGKLDGAAAYPPWSGSIGYRAGSIVSHHGRLWRVDDELVGVGTTVEEPDDTSGEWYEVFLKDLKQDALSPAQLAAANSGATAAKVATWDGYAAQIAAKASASDVNTALAQKAPLADLPYALVTPGEWEFSGSGYDPGDTYRMLWFVEQAEWSLEYYTGDVETPWFLVETKQGEEDDLVVDFDNNAITATRASLPGHLLDRAVNAVAVSSATTLTLPAANPGHARDLLVRLSVSTASTVTWQDDAGNVPTWDAMGAPDASFEEGVYLYRVSEVAPGVFHAADITSGGSIDPSVLDEKLDASSAAPPFSESLAYLVGEYVTYGGALYRCKTDVTTAGAWTGTSNWEAVDMTTPDATLDIMSDGRLRVVSAAGDNLWMQGYDLASASAVALACDRVNMLSFPATTASAFDSTATYAVGDSVVYDGMVYKFTAAHSAGAWIGTDAAVDSVSLTMPHAPVGKVGDFVLDVDNSANASVKMVAELSGLFTSFDVIVPKGQNLFTDILTFAGGEECELYFTTTAFGTSSKPAWKVVKQVVEKQEAGS